MGGGRTCGFYPFSKKFNRQPIPNNSWLFPTVGCGYPYKKHFLKSLVLPSDSTFGTPITKIFCYFLFIQKNLFTNPSWNNCKKIFLDFWDPPTTIRKKNISYMECWVSKKGKKGDWSSFPKDLLENIKKWRCWL